ncbi:MAG: Rrf2 family transcriptional regulator [Candidatus Hydrogenedentes bacterium]|nr:Rrf2 family transcriptional regulator [Candidatus Hydrogenedentota bacterium]
MLSKTAKHALRALVLLAQAPQGEPQGAADIAARIDAPKNYLSKMLKVLAEHGVLASQKGMGGGFILARPANEIRLLDIVDPFDRVRHWTDCIMGMRACSSEKPCALHDKAAAVRTGYIQLLEESTLADAAEMGEAQALME